MPRKKKEESHRTYIGFTDEEAETLYKLLEELETYELDRDEQRLVSRLKLDLGVAFEGKDEAG